ncbi:MAG: ATP-binding protein [Defluviitaleaceae bacterium]|nr:ATP-binding protein [Defluviitaleaceae bacterium]
MKKIDEQLIEELIASKTEGSYWDFKAKWHTNKADLLHDIICMANNLNFCDGYIIIGVDESMDYRVCGVEADTGRKNTNELVCFLRDKNFAGGIRPTVSMHTIHTRGHEVDVVKVASDNNTPYYLTKKFTEGGILPPNSIYTRIQDTNTPKDSSADLHHVEKLWRKRFGLDSSIKDRFSMLLENFEDWEEETALIGDGGCGYNKTFPEFRIEIEAGYDDKGIFCNYENEVAWFFNKGAVTQRLKLMYHSIPVLSWYLIYFINPRILIPYAEKEFFDNLRLSDFGVTQEGEVLFSYEYYDLSNLQGKLYKFMTKSREGYCFRGEKGTVSNEINMYLVFKNDFDRGQFHSFVLNRYKELDAATLKDRFSMYLSGENEGRNALMLNVIIASELYNMWICDAN